MTFTDLFRRTFASVFAACLALPALAYDFGQPFGFVRGWQVDMNLNSGCIAYRGGGEPGDMLLLHIPPGGSFQLAVVSYTPDGTEIPGGLAIGDWYRPLNFYVSDQMAWETADPDTLTRLARADMATFTFEGYSYPSRLAGSTAAILKLAECWEKLGEAQGIDVRNSREYAALQNDLAGVRQGAAVAPAEAEPGPEEPSRPVVLGIEPVPAVGGGCPAAGSVRSPGSNAAQTVSFVNVSPHDVTIYWVDFDGNLQYMAPVAAGAATSIQTYAGHLFLARDSGGVCHGGLLEVGPAGGSFTLP